jgi:hypothetical protein
MREEPGCGKFEWGARGEKKKPRPEGELAGAQGPGEVLRDPVTGGG